jgi:hypothetical protein
MVIKLLGVLAGWPAGEQKGRGRRPENWVRARGGDQVRGGGRNESDLKKVLRLISVHWSPLGSTAVHRHT